MGINAYSLGLFLIEVNKFHSSVVGWNIKVIKLTFKIK